MKNIGWVEWLVLDIKMFENLSGSPKFLNSQTREYSSADFVATGLLRSSENDHKTKDPRGIPK